MAEFNSHSQCQIHSRKEVRKLEIKMFPSPQPPSPSLRRSVCNYTVGMWDCGTMSRPPQKMNPSCLNSLQGTIFQQPSDIEPEKTQIWEIWNAHHPHPIGTLEPGPGTGYRWEQETTSCTKCEDNRSRVVKESEHPNSGCRWEGLDVLRNFVTELGALSWGQREGSVGKGHHVWQPTSLVENWIQFPASILTTSKPSSGILPFELHQHI